VEITFPVSKDAALVAYPGARASNSVATDEIVAHVNARTVHMTDGVIMHAHDDFLIHRSKGEIRKGSEYFHYIRESKRRGILRP
jgi:ketosteroid isomerase-like protein